MNEITVVCNNISGENRIGLKRSWGFSVLLNINGEYILFDTGKNGEELIYNLRRLEVAPGRITKVVISHGHRDHTGGLAAFLKEYGKDMEVLFPYRADKLTEKISPICKQITFINKNEGITQNVFTSGPVGFLRREQALVIRSEKGLIIVTGCAHPGIVRMVKAIKRIFRGHIHAILGGFHLEYHPPALTGYFIRQLRKQGVEKIGANHCTGKSATRLLSKAYGDNYIDFALGDKFAFV